MSFPNKVINKGAKPWMSASLGTAVTAGALWVLCGCSVPPTSFIRRQCHWEPLSSTHTSWAKPCWRSSCTLGHAGHPCWGRGCIWWGCPATQEPFPWAAGLGVQLGLLLLPEGACLNHSQNLKQLSAQIHVLFSEPKHRQKKTLRVSYWVCRNSIGSTYRFQQAQHSLTCSHRQQKLNLGALIIAAIW